HISVLQRRRAKRTDGPLRFPVEIVMAAYRTIDVKPSPKAGENLHANLRAFERRRHGTLRRTSCRQGTAGRTHQAVRRPGTVVRSRRCAPYGALAPRALHRQSSLKVTNLHAFAIKRYVYR